MPATTNYLPTPAASLGKDIPCDYYIQVGGKKTRTTGTVLSTRRIGQFLIEVTLQHRRTGQIHVNTLDARDTVYVFAPFLQDGFTEEIQAGIPAIHAELGEILTESREEQLRNLLKSNMWNFSGAPIEA